MPIPLIAPMLAPEVSKLLWNFGFRWHPELQTRWIEGAAGLATTANLVDQPPQNDPFDEMAEDFLAQNNPALLEAIRKTPAEERSQLLRKLEKNFEDLSGLITALRETQAEENSNDE